MNIFEAKEGNVTLMIYRDDMDESPRQWDNISTMICWHKQYNLGDKHSYDNPSDFQNEWNDKNAIILPLYLYDHSGITISTNPFSCPWDSGQVGYVYVSKENVRNDMHPIVERISKKRRQRAINLLKSEVKTYDMYLTGEVFGFQVEQDGEFIDGCGGFYGDNWKENGIMEHIPEIAIDLIDKLESTI